MGRFVAGTVVLASTMASGGLDAMAAKISEACEAGEKFIEVFYDTMDKRRQVNCASHGQYF